MVDICLVQASRVLPDADVIAAIPPLTKWAAGLTSVYGLEPATFSFMSLADFVAGKAAGAWPLFLNKHSTEPDALGFHDAAGGTPYGRSFSGDDMLDRINPWVTLSHEAGEMILNPFVRIFITLRDGSRVPKEACDAVEDDIQAITIDNMPFSNFVFPAYWEDAVARPPGTKFDYQGRLRGPCPALTPGGYQAILRPGASDWTQITERRSGNGRTSVRADRQQHSHRITMLHLAMPAP